MGCSVLIACFTPRAHSRLQCLVKEPFGGYAKSPSGVLESGHSSRTKGGYESVVLHLSTGRMAPGLCI
jgi:hypothetical protein